MVVSWRNVAVDSRKEADKLILVKVIVMSNAQIILFVYFEMINHWQRISGDCVIDRVLLREIRCQYGSYAFQSIANCILCLLVLIY